MQALSFPKDIPALRHHRLLVLVGDHVAELEQQVGRELDELDGVALGAV